MLFIFEVIQKQAGVHLVLLVSLVHLIHMKP